MPQINIIRKKEDDRKKIYTAWQNTLSNVENKKNLGVIIVSRFVFREDFATKTILANSMVTIIKNFST